MKRMARTVIVVLLVGVSCSAVAGNNQVIYPKLNAPGLPIGFATDLTISTLPNEVYAGMDTQLVSPKSVSKISVFEGDIAGGEKISDEYFFDKQGRISQKISYYHGSSPSKSSFTYDSVGNLIGKNDDVAYRYVNLSDGLIAREKSYKEGEFSVDVVFNAKGNITSYENSTFKYDDSGRVAEISMPEPGVICFSGCTPFVIDVEYPITGTVAYRPRSVPSEVTIYKFSKNSMYLRSYSYHKPHEIQESLTFDAKGNWVEEKESFPGSANTRTNRREITYR